MDHRFENEIDRQIRKRSLYDFASMGFERHWYVPTSDDDRTVDITLESGGVVTLVGPNGAGKSSLISWIISQTMDVPVRRLAAHRRIWFKSSGVELTSSMRSQYVEFISRHDRDINSRTNGEYEEQRLNGTLFDLLGKEVNANAQLVRNFREGECSESLGSTPLETISKIMQSCGLNLGFQLSDGMGLDAVRNNSRYPISKMSDGEKSALLLAADVLLAPLNSIQLIDEPERHLHRSISPGLISSLIEARPDCGFVLSTHDVELVETINPEINSVYLVDGMRWSTDGAPLGWHIESLATKEPINERLKRAILGGRRRILFVEGEPSSLDCALLGTLFPDYHISPSGSSENVQKVVTGIRETDGFHWISGWGVVDGDNRDVEESEKLRAKGILVLPCNEIKSLLYLPDVIEALAKQQGENLGSDGNAMFEEAKRSALATLDSAKVQENLAATNAVKILRRRVLGCLPSKGELKDNGESFSLNLTSPYPQELSKLRAALSSQDLETIVKEFSIRDTGLPKAVANSLRYRSSEDYGRAVVATLNRDSALAARIIRFLGWSSMSETPENEPQI